LRLCDNYAICALQKDHRAAKGAAAKFFSLGQIRAQLATPGLHRFIDWFSLTEQLVERFSEEVGYSILDLVLHGYYCRDSGLHQLQGHAAKGFV